VPRIKIFSFLIPTSTDITSNMLKSLSAFFLSTSQVLATAPPTTWNTFPDGKSKHLANAPPISFYTGSKGGRSMEEVEENVPILQLEDPHAVVMAAGKHGVTYIAGKTMECGDHCAPPQRVASSSDAFAMKMDASGLPVWGWKSNLAKKDAANGIAVLPSGDVLVGGYRYVNGIGVRSVTKLSGDSGTEDWTMTSFGDGIGQYAGAMDAESKQMFGMHGAIELITIEGDDVIISGYTRSGGLKGHAGDLQFKSYGNSGGKAWVAKIPVSKMESNTAFSTSDLTWAKDFDDYDNAKAGYVVKKNGHVAVLLWAENGKQNGKSCGLRMLGKS
jgi:hypothetical protein